MPNKTVIVAVGSENKTKIQPVFEVFSCHFPKVQVISCKVKSGVREQPLTDEEAFQGAFNRATRALKTVKNAQFGGGHRYH